MNIKTVKAQMYDVSNDEYIDYSSYNVRHIKATNRGITSSSGTDFSNMISSFFVTNEFFNDSEFVSGTYIGSGSIDEDAKIETEFIPNLIFIHGKKNSTSDSEVIGVLYPKLGFGKMFFAYSGEYEGLQSKSTAHGLNISYYDGVTTIKNAYVDKKNNPTMYTRLNEKDVEYSYIAFG